jgi:uncharacterized protein (DUF433 family)
VSKVETGCAKIADMNLQGIPSLLQNHFEQTSDVLGGKLRLRGTRVSVKQVLELLEAGVPPA